MFRSKKTITAVEIGTGSIKVVMGQPAENGSIVIIGHGEISSLTRVAKGEAINVSEVGEALGEVLDNVESVSGQRITSVYLAMTGSHIQSTNVIGSVPITSPNRIISEIDIIEATRNARSFNLPLEQKGIHTFQRTFIIDDARRVSNPEGMVGNKLTADIHVIYGNFNKIQTLCTLIDDVLGVPARDIAFSGIADFYGVSLDRESKNGSLIIDIGAGVTEYATFYNSGCLHSGQITVGCEHIANDLSIGLNLPIGKCRELLKNQRSSMLKIDSVNNSIQIEQGIGNQPKCVNEGTIQTIVELRLVELFEIIREELANSFLDEHLNMTKLLGDGIILCGGGALIPDITKIVESIFGVPIKIGRPVNISGMEEEINSPRYVTTIGLLHLGHRLSQMDKETLSFRQTAENELTRIFDLCRKAFRF